MAVSSTSSSGSIDVSYIVSALSGNFTNSYITPIQTQKTAKEAQQTSLSAISSLISTLDSSLTALRSGSAFTALTATSTDEDVLTAAADTTAVSGSYNISVTQLAQIHKVASGQFTSTNTAISTAAGAGAKTFDLVINGTTTNLSVTVNAGDDDQTVLTNIAAAINSSGAEATAIVVHETGTTTRLIISSNDSGTANAITLTDTGGNTVLQSAQVINGAGVLVNQLQAAANAQFSIDTVNFTRSSNTVSDALTGVTIQLKDTGTSILAVKGDSSAMQDSIETFIDAYNAVIDKVRTETKYDPDTKESGTLLSNAFARTLESQMRPLVTNIVSGLPAQFNSLYMIGIQMSKDGKLSISDSSKLKSALENNTDDVKSIFNDTTDGVAVRLDTYLSQITTSTGALSLAKSTILDQIDRLESWIESRQRQLEDLQESWYRKYSQVQSLLTTNQNIISSLSGYSLIPT